jgi:WD40 repeat protein
MRKLIALIFCGVLCTVSWPIHTQAQAFDFPQGVIAISPDRTMLALAPIEIVDNRTRNTREIRIYSLSTKELLRSAVLEKVDSSVSYDGIEALDWMGDHLLADDAFHIYVVNASTFEVVHAEWLPGINAAKWSPDAAHYVLAGTFLGISSMSQDKPVTFDSGGAKLTGDTIESVRWSPDSRALALGMMNGVIDLWTADGKFVAELGASPTSGLPWMNVMAWSPDSRYFAYVLAAHPSKIDIFDMHEKVINNAFVTRNVQISSLAWALDNKTLAMNATNGTLIVWDSKTNAQQIVAQGGEAESYPNAVIWSPDGTHLVASRGYTITVWDTGTWQETLHADGYPLYWITNTELLANVMNATANGYNTLTIK